MRELKGKVAVITGGASGIGRAMAQRFAREGMKLVLGDVEEAPLANTREELAAVGAEVRAVRTDVSSRESVEELARKTFEAFGTAHLVCNNAGVGSTAGASWDLTQADWEWTLGVNLWGVIHGVRAFVPRLLAQGEGHVVNTASISGLITLPGMSPYCVTKHAVVALSECMYHDLQLRAGGKVGVSVLCPAWVKTRINESARNRPAALQTSKRALTADQRVIEGAVRAAVEQGIPPEVVADKVHDAVVSDRFYILTHSKTKELIEKRMQQILETTNPQYEPVAR
jgi:NAD(P)-dependent dehydrogenase (short-subunit alcohol dehydrogenase family)